MSTGGMNITLEIWRQPNAKASGKFERHEMKNVSPDSSFLEMLDQLNDKLESSGAVPVTFESDCREGICGACSLVINGTPHGPQKAITTCQLHMRSFKDGDTIIVEPWRATAFPVIKDLMVDRSSMDRIIQAGGFISVRTGVTTDTNAIPIPKPIADAAMDAAACIGCGACVAACKNASAMLFTSAKVSHLNLLPQGQPERYQRAAGMLAAHDEEGFGACTNEGECEAACPKGISISNISRMNRDVLVHNVKNLFS